MDREVLGIIEQIQDMARGLLDILQEDKINIEEASIKILGISDIIQNLETIIPGDIYKEYEEFFDTICMFGRQCGNAEFLIQQMDNLKSSFALFVECMEDMHERCSKKIKRCICCGKDVAYFLPLPAFYESMQKKYGTYRAKSETLNKNEYMCPSCGASDRDRLITSFLQKEGLQEAAEGTRLLQFAPAAAISEWISLNCPHIAYETTDLLMEHVTFQADIMNMDMVPDETYDVIICSHVLEHVPDDGKALGEMKRILKPAGKIVFLVPIDLNASCIDEEWGLSEEENWRRFGQGDHCRRYSKDGLLQRLESQFYVHGLGKEYFGDDVFSQGGLTETSMLYVLTKSDDVPLSMADTIVIDKELCKEGPLVSVILPCYNHEKYVAAAIESVINQSYKNIEIIIADDGSTDNTAAIMKKYSSYFAKEIYYKENAGGRAKILQQYAKGKYIALMHSDDLWEKDKLALQVAYMEEHEECGACLAWSRYIDEEQQELEDYTFIKANRSSYEWMRYFWMEDNALCNPSSLVRREIGLRVQKYGWFCRQLPDFFKWIDMVQYTSIHIIPKTLIKMHRNRGNTSAVSQENILRHNVEAGCNWLGVIRDMEPDFFKKAFHDLMIHPEENTEIGIQCEKYFLMLHHHSVFVQNSAMCYFSEICNEVCEYMEREYHYTRKDFAADMVSKGIAQLL